MEKNKGSRGGGRPSKGGSKELRPKDATPKLADLGVTKDQSSRWQKLAALPKDEQEEKIEAAKRKAEAAIEPPPKRDSVFTPHFSGPISPAHRPALATRRCTPSRSRHDTIE